MRMILHFIVPAALFSLLPALLYSQPSESMGGALSLQQAIELALENHPSLKAAEANIRTASGTLTQAKAAYLPSLNASGTAQRTDGAFVLNPTFPPRNQTYNTYTAGFAGSLTLFDFGRTINKVSASSDLLDASSLDYEASRATVLANVEIAYFGVVQARQVLEVNEEAVDQGTKHLTQAKAFYNVGRRPFFDVTKAEVDLANANVNLIKARNTLRVANIQLENAIGVHPRNSYILIDTLSITPFTIGLDSIKEVTFEKRPELQAARIRVDANRSLVTAAWDQHLPTISAFGNWTWSNFDFPLFSRWNAGLTLTVPLFQGFSVVGQVEQAQATADAAQANLEVLREAILLEVEQAYYGLREADERLAATSKLVEQAEQNMTLADRQYAAGVGTALEAADARLSLSNARITNIQAVYDHSSSLVRLQKAMGVLGN